ncbi:MAG: tRNA (N6-threonylcarbamoyladenosine(37)-N6)-methyltransferase TrmO [Bacteroidetes bacterium]|nr:MAG: tRNA (N6-threonylcarbamoyladenosine(37)-N6)-methyltransferase TrmO [Bacteroidota bacterium]
MIDKDSICFSAIGYIETLFDDKEWIPRQGRYDQTAKGVAVVNPEYKQGLESLGSYRYCWLLFHFDKSKTFSLLQPPPKDDKPHGVFSIRSPRRPNGIGMTVVKIDKIEKNKIYFTGADMISGTPLIDIKPYVENIDSVPGAGNGWMDE